MTNKNIDKLPETYTVSYYNPETDQNLSAEEWSQLNSTANPSEIRITNQGEVYRSWKADVNDPTYGPGLWDDFLKPVGKTVGSALGAAAIIATGPIAIPLSISVAAGGAIEKKIAENSEGVLPDCVREYLDFGGDNAVNAGSSAIAVLTLGKVNIKK